MRKEPDLTSFTLPDGYGKIRTVNLTQDRGPAGVVSLLALVITAGMILLGRLHLPLSALLRPGAGATLFSLALLLVAFVVYIIGHELVHGFFIRLFSGRRAQYGFNWLYAWAGSEAYFSRRQYIIIALAPVVLFGGLFLALNLLLPAPWFWHAFLLQVANLAGAAGDYYIVALTAKMPAGLLVRDPGFEMAFFAPAGGEQSSH